jgi:hypothetical protein
MGKWLVPAGTHLGDAKFCSMGKWLVPILEHPWSNRSSIKTVGAY